MKHPIDDTLLKEILKRELPSAPENKWFVRKVMNRLPEKTQNITSVIEYIGFAIAFVILGFYWYQLFTNAESAKVITVGDIISYCILTAMTFSLVIGILISQLQKE